MSDPQPQWSREYADLVDRNIGLLTEKQQERLRRAKVSVCGVGGLGGTAFEVLVRCGISRFSILDKDAFEPTNLNRQIFAYAHTLGRKKVEVAAEWAKAIHSAVDIEAYDRVGEDNVEAILAGSSVIVLALDQLKAVLIISRKAREMGIPLVEGWALPYANVRVFTPQTPTLEEAYGLPTSGRPLASLGDDELRRLGTDVLFGLRNTKGLPAFYSDAVMEQVRKGRLTSFAPMVWLTAVLMALEAVKVLLNWGQIALGPAFTLYDPFRHRIPE